MEPLELILSWTVSRKPQWKIPAFTMQPSIPEIRRQPADSRQNTESKTTYTDLKAFACADNLDAVYIASQTASTMNRSHFSYPMESMCCARSPLPPMPGGESHILYQGPAKSDMSSEIAEWLRLISAGPGSNVHNPVFPDGSSGHG